MSTRTQNSRRSARAARRRDGGFTLPELLITITMMGLLAAVVSAAISVTFRTATGTEGQANVARAESAIDTWLPADLASTDVNNDDLAGTGEASVNTDPAAKPCNTAATCGSIPFYDSSPPNFTATNALQLAWETDGVITRVQYQYIQIGSEWQLRRISCVGGNPCSVTVILHDLDGPPDPATFDAQTTEPVWVLDVATPNNPVGLDLSKNARRIVVTIDGGGENAGAGGGLNSISLTAGGRDTDTIDADDFTVPSFVRANSRCGGPLTLIVDESGSIDTSYLSNGSTVTNPNMATVIKPGVKAFIEAFRGTPTQIQVVKFDRTAEAIGPNRPDIALGGTSDNGGWHRYIDMTNESDVNLLLGAVDSDLSSNGGTNWEDAFFHTFKESNGDNAAIQPNRLVFFTDGIPTFHRLNHRNGGARDYNDGPYTRVFSNSDNWGYITANGQRFSQEAWDRTDVIFDDHRSVESIFVGVGAGLGLEYSGPPTNPQWNYWIYNPAAYTNRNSPRGNHSILEGDQILAYLLTNSPGSSPSGEVRATYDPVEQEYTNAQTADFYVQDDFDAVAFAAAMRAAALKDCGGTLTVQTRDLATGNPVGKEFVYENADYRDDTGTSLNPEPRKVTTSQYFRTGTFDFEISDSSEFFNVDVFPAELQTLGGYQFEGWDCTSGSNFQEKDIPGSTFKGFSIDVSANQAVSCIMKVS